MIKYVRVFISIMLFFTAIRKLYGYYNGNVSISLPLDFYLGIDLKIILISIIFIEILIVIMLYKKTFFIFGISILYLLLSVGIIISILSIYLDSISNCGCGLLGNNPHIYLLQKSILVISTLYIHLKRKELFYEISYNRL